MSRSQGRAWHAFGPGGIGYLHTRAAGVVGARVAIVTIGLAISAAMLAAATAKPCAAQQQPSSQPQAKTQPVAPSRAELANDAAVLLVAGRPGAEFLEIADDIATVTSDGRTLRVLPVVSDGGAQNIRDLVLLRNVDLALTQVTTLNRMLANRDLERNLDRQILYIAPLFYDELHVLVRGEINSLADLQGKRVNFSNEGSGTDYLLPPLLQGLGLKVQKVNLGQTEAIERLRRGELDATVCICLKPVRPFAGLKPEFGLKLLAVPLGPALDQNYLPAKLESRDYPGLLREGEKVDTVAVQTVLVTYNWPRNSVRYNKLVRFVEAMFSKFQEFSRPGRHERWPTVNIAAVVPGWQRFPAAQEWLDAHAKTTSAELKKKDFSNLTGDQIGGPSDSDTERLFREFLQWRRDRGN